MVFNPEVMLPSRLSCRMVGLFFRGPPDIYQDYGLYIADPDGSNMELAL
jgi:hypothetical protein